MTGIVRQRDVRDSVDLPSKLAPSSVAPALVAIVVRDVIRDPQGHIARVVGHLLIEAGLHAREATISLVGVDQSGSTTVVERCGRSDLVPVHAGRCAERLDFVIDVRQRLTPAFETPLGERWWELRAVVRGVPNERLDRLRPLLAVRQRVDVPSVRRSIRVLANPAADVERSNWIGWIPSSLRPTAYAFDPTSNATGRAFVRSRGDWGVVDVRDDLGRRWSASILQYEVLGDGTRHSASVGGRRIETVYSRPLVGGPNTLEFVLPPGVAPSHAGPLLTTWYELRIHTDDGRRLGARHRVEVLY